MESPSSPTNRDLLSTVDDPALALGWLLELALIWVRWSIVLPCLLLPVLVPVVTPAFAAALALGLALGNAGIAWSARRPLRLGRLPTIRAAATALEWAAALAVIALLAPDPASNAAGVLPLLVLLAAMRFSWPGLVAAAVAGKVALGLLAIIQVGVLRVTDAPTAVQEWTSRFILITLTLAVGGALLWSGHRWRRWHQARWPRAHAALRLLQFGLSMREMELLPWLAHKNLTYEEIGRQFHTSADTVKTHVQRIGRKLGTTGGRRPVVASARERGLLPPLPAASSNDLGD